jgi:hypothetical protein
MFANKKDIRKLEDVQIRALRFVLKDFSSCKSIVLRQSETSSLNLTNLRLLAIEVFKCLHNLNPSYMRDMFSVKEVPYALRNNSLLCQPKVFTTKFGIRSFRYFGSKVWNMLPSNIKNSENLSQFKEKINSWTLACQCPMCIFFMS